MNELEKTVAPEDTVTPTPEVAETENTCIEESSPSSDLAQVADAQTEDGQTEEEKADSRRIHFMSKEELRDTLKAILESGNMEAHKEVTAIKQAFFNLKNRENMELLDAYVEAGNDPATFSAQPDEVENELKTLYADFKERRADYLAAEEARRAANLEKKQEILTCMEEIAGDIDNVNTKFPDFQKLQSDFKEIKEVPPTAETEIWKQFQNVVERFYDNLKINKELRDFDFRRNLEAKRALIEEAKKLEAMSDPVVAFRVLQGLHDQWRAVGPVAKEIRESVWDEFKEASTVVNRRHQEYFEQRKAAELVNEEAKSKLCEEIESIDTAALKTFSDWNSSTDRIVELQKKWREYGYASKKANTVLYSRFRKACDEFFAAKAVYFQRAKDEFNENLVKKTALCEKAEALKNTEDIRKAADEVVKLQAEWKSIGSVPRKQSDALWQRFTTACNYFFDERKRQSKERHREEQENLEKKRDIIARLSELPKDGDRKEIMPRIKELQAEWQTVGFVPFKMKDKIFTEYRAVCDALYDAYNQREARRRMNDFQNRVSEIKGDGSKVSRERDRLVRICESRKAELKTIENNMGFFSIKSSAGNSMLKDMDNKVKRLKDDIKELEQKIALLDSEK
jgi:predicted nuclease with TOPRIM domain